MKLSGYFNGEHVTFYQDNAGRLIMAYDDGTEERYNEEYYDDDSWYMTIRTMLTRDGVLDLHETDE